jgi:hypothetical protein
MDNLRAHGCHGAQARRSDSDRHVRWSSAGEQLALFREPAAVTKASPPSALRFRRRRRAQLAAAMTDLIDSYSPARMSATTWARLKPLVVRAATATLKSHPYRPQLVMSTIAGLARWADRQGFDLRDEVVLHPGTIDNYLVKGCAHLSQNTQANYGSLLRRAGSAVLGPPLYPPPTLSLPKPDPIRPYTEAEFDSIVNWLRGLPTVMLRENALALVAACAGAGLTAHEVTRLVGSDVVQLPDCVAIRVHSARAREVPVLRQWEHDVLARARSVGDRRFFLPQRTRLRKNDISNFLDRCPSSDIPEVRIARLRTTWIVGHLANGTPLNALAAAAGVDGVQLGRLVRFLPAPGDHERRQLRDLP